MRGRGVREKRRGAKNDNCQKLFKIHSRGQYIQTKQTQGKSEKRGKGREKKVSPIAKRDSRQ